MREFDQRSHISFDEAIEALPEMGGTRFLELFRHGTLSVEIFAPRERDVQTPHTRDELYVVARGRGVFVCEGKRTSFGPNDILFAPAGAEHRFERFSPDLTVWVIFYGPPGGERHAVGGRPA